MTSLGSLLALITTVKSNQFEAAVPLLGRWLPTDWELAKTWANSLARPSRLARIDWT